MKDMWKNGILGVVVGDALGCPVQFESREEVAEHPVTGMRGYGTFNLPEGSWTDDSSLTLALLDSINQKRDIDLNHIMDNFVEWLLNGEFTPYGYAYDIGNGTMQAIRSYMNSHDPFTCGGRGENNNGNGSLMRIMPVCLYCIEKQMEDSLAIKTIHHVASLTHAHIRSNIACGLYYFMAKSIVNDEGTLFERLESGIDYGFQYYEWYKYDWNELEYYRRLRDLEEFAKTPVEKIKSSGYVVDTLEASVWSLINSNSYKNALLTAVNLGLDTDTVGAVTGGLGALFYGCGGEYGIPLEWIEKLQRKEWIKMICEIADNRIS